MRMPVEVDGLVIVPEFVIVPVFVIEATDVDRVPRLIVPLFMRVPEFVYTRAPLLKVVVPIFVNVPELLPIEPTINEIVPVVALFSIKLLVKIPLLVKVRLLLRAPLRLKNEPSKVLNIGSSVEVLVEMISSD